MTAPPRCPFESEIDRLLVGPADDAAWHALESHVDSCASCRHRLAQASDLGTLVPGGPSTTLTSSSSALNQVIDKLQCGGPVPPVPSPSPAAPNADYRLLFLKPTDRMGYLGRLGNYEIHRVLGQGGAGMVLEALDPLLKRTVAIKTLAPWRVLDDETRQRFLREAQSAAALVHENVVAIYAVEQADALPYLVLEYVAGQTLHDRVQREGRLPLAEVIDLGVQIARGLAAAHSRSLIHRDIKPGNILLDGETGRAKIADFGLAKSIGEGDLTITGTLLGTPEFMSPEQAERQEPDERSDIFSLGAVLYFMATGVSPFRGSSLFDTLDNVRRCQPRPIQTLEPRLPNWFSDLVHRLLAKNPQQRLGWAKAVAEVLLQHGAQTTLVEPTTQQPTLRMPPTPTVAKPVQRGPAGRWIAAAALAAVAIVASIIIGVQIWNAPVRSKRDTAAVLPVVESTPSLPAPLPSSGIRIVGHSELHSSLSEAIAAATDNEVIEVHGSGPYLTSPIEVVGKRLTLRAAPGSRPQILSEMPLVSSGKSLLATDRDLDLQGLEFRWSIENNSVLSEADMLSRSVIRATQGKLTVDRCRIVSERWNACIGASATDVAVKNSHLVAKTGGGVYWRADSAGELIVENCVFESRYGLTLFIDGPAATGQSDQVRLSHCTFATERVLQTVVSLPIRQSLPIAAEDNIFAADTLFFVLPVRGPRAKVTAKPDDPVKLFQWMIAWTERENVYRSGIHFLARPQPGKPGTPLSSNVEQLSDWLDIWKHPAPPRSIEGDIQFQQRADNASLSPLVLEKVEQPTGALPKNAGAQAREVGPPAR